jgi:hypothetical protein
MRIIARDMLFSTGLLLAATSAFARPAPAPDYVCVRNFIPQDSRAAGDSGSLVSDYDDMFARVQPAEDRAMDIVTKKYDSFYCDSSPKEFKWVLTMDAGKICTVDFHQEGVSEYCYSNPKIFSWARLTTAP